MKLMQKKRGSLLAYSLIVLAVMLVIAIGMSTVSIKNRNNAITSSSSAQSFQIADSGVNLVTNAMGVVLGTDPINGRLRDLSIAGAGPCVTVGGKAQISGDAAGGKYTVEFYDTSPVPVAISSCNNVGAEVDNVGKIKAIGEFKDTSRSIEVALAAGDDIAYYYVNPGCAINNAAYQNCGVARQVVTNATTQNIAINIVGECKGGDVYEFAVFVDNVQHGASSGALTCNGIASGGFHFNFAAFAVANGNHNVELRAKRNGAANGTVDSYLMVIEKS